MLGHFLKRDFRDFLVWWVVIGIVTITFALLHLIAGGPLGAAALFSGYPVLFLAYFLFANLPMNHVLGSLWRTQHGWSRHYLLALPLSHRTLFAILHARMVVFWLPLVVATSVAGALFGWALGFSARQWALCCLGLVTSVFLMLEMNIWSALQMERIRGYIPGWLRVRAWVSMIVAMYGLMGLLGIAWFSVLIQDRALPEVGSPGLLAIAHWRGAAWVLFPFSFVLAALWARWNARRWCVTL